MTLKPAEYVCGECALCLSVDLSGNHYDGHGDVCEGPMSARFTRDDLVQIAIEAYADANVYGDAEALVAEMLGEVEK